MAAQLRIYPSDNSTVEYVRDRLLEDGFFVLPASRLGFGREFREHVVRTYYAPGVMRLDAHDILDRQRVRDVVRYAWDGRTVRLTEHSTIEDSGGETTLGKPEYRRTTLLQDVRMADWIGMVLSLVPVSRRHERGSCSVNLVRTHTKVVPGAPHQDGKDFVVIYVLDRVGGGAETRIVKDAVPHETVFLGTLAPGDLLVLDDRLFRHGTTPLTAEEGTTPHRDAILCTVDYPHEHGIDDRVKSPR